VACPAPPVTSSSPRGTRRDVGCTIRLDVHEPSTIALQIAPATMPADRASERLVVSAADGEPCAVIESTAPHNGRVHVVEAPPGPLTVTYSTSTNSIGPDGPVSGSSLVDDEVITALRQSRYCPSDAIGGFARAELGPPTVPGRTARAVASWVFERVAYISGSSQHTDTALETLMSGRGVCRDFAHLTIAMCRALGVPARFVSVYAPGLAWMDFHVVVEIWCDGRWEVLDPTRLAPRSALVRIATGRDAADTAFMATLRGDVELLSSEVFAVVDGDLPFDDHETVTTLALG